MRALAAIAVLACFAPEAGAQPAPSCTISVTSVAFGTYNVFAAAPADSTGTITYSCNSRARDIVITLSTGSSAGFTPRTLTRGTERLNYNLYTSAARTNIWGDGTSGTSFYSIANPPNNTNVNIIVYGRIPPAQDVSAGSYSDTVFATVNF